MTNKGKKSFFYHPTYRANIYLLAWVYIWCFRFIGLIYPKSKEIVEKYESGESGAPMVIGFASSLIISSLLALTIFNRISWSLNEVGVLSLLYILFGFMGWLSLIKLRDYELEKQ